MTILPLSEISPEAFFTINEQTEIFLLSVLLGGIFGVIYDVFRALRVVAPPLRGTAATAVCDIIFFMICGFGIYLFSLTFARGEVRGYYWIGALLGGIIYLMTAGTVVIGIIRAVFGAVSAAVILIYNWTNRNIIMPAVKFYTEIRTKIRNKFVSNAKKSATKHKSKKNHLKNRPEILYNIRAKMKKV